MEDMATRSQKENDSFYGKGFQGQHLLRLSINFVVINKDLGKLQTQLYYIKVGFCYDQVYNDTITYFTCS